MLDLLSVQDAANALDLSPNRVRALVGRGQLPASKIGGRWLLERAAVEARRREAHASGRPFEPHNAWALLRLASGQPVETIDPSVRSRLRRALLVEGLNGLRPRLLRRAESRFFSAHPGEVAHLVADPALVKSGISAAASYGIDLVSGSEADGYLAAELLEGFEARHALVASEQVSANVRIRIVPNYVWPLVSEGQSAPIAAVAVDLAEDADPRSARAGQLLLEEINGDRRP